MTTCLHRNLLPGQLTGFKCPITEPQISFPPERIRGTAPDQCPAHQVPSHLIWFLPHISSLNLPHNPATKVTFTLDFGMSNIIVKPTPLLLKRTVEIRTLLHLSCWVRRVITQWLRTDTCIRTCIKTTYREKHLSHTPHTETTYVLLTFSKRINRRKQNATKNKRELCPKLKDV